MSSISIATNYSSETEQQYLSWKHQQQLAHSRVERLDRFQDDLGDYMERENNLIFLGLLVFISCLLAVFMLWWNPRPSTKIGSSPTA